ncbi:hypothetical protein Trydic_g19935, partial [Trypoxylus dichotomus]
TGDKCVVIRNLYVKFRVQSNYMAVSTLSMKFQETRPAKFYDVNCEIL